MENRKTARTGKEKSQMGLRKKNWGKSNVRTKCIEPHRLHVTGEYGALGHAEGTEDWPRGEFDQSVFYILSGSAHPK